jgi:CubicO group peptidase (beta-lactamase class C family)
MRFFSVLLLAVLLVASPHSIAAPDEDALGKQSGYPRGGPNTLWQERFRIGSFCGIDRILHCNTVNKGPKVFALQRATTDPSFSYRFDGKDLTINDYLQRQRVTGLVIIKDGEILVERYQYDRKSTDRFLSNSMAKSIVSLVIGIAIQERKIASLDDNVAKYEPRLAGCAYGETSIRKLLRMSSGVRFVEDYHGSDDMERFEEAIIDKGMIPAIRLFSDRPTPQGAKMVYASSETAVLSMALRGAVGCSVSQHVSEKIWQPIGAQDDAKWGTFGDGIELAYGYFNATLRDYGRLGCLLANDGALDGRQIVPRDYLIEATDWHKQPLAFRPSNATPYYGYGYQFWIFPGERRRFALLGIYGQAIFVDPGLKLVMVHTAVSKDAIDIGMSRERDALWRGIVRHYAEW